MTESLDLATIGFDFESSVGLTLRLSEQRTQWLSWQETLELFAWLTQCMEGEQMDDTLHGHIDEMAGLLAHAAHLAKGQPQQADLLEVLGKLTEHVMAVSTMLGMPAVADDEDD